MRGTSRSGRQVRSNKPVAYLNDDRECGERVDSRKTGPATRHGFHYIRKYQGLSEIYSVFCLRVKKIPNFYDVGPQDRAFLLFKEVAVLRNATAWATSYHLQMKSKIVTAISALKRKTVDTVQINNLKLWIQLAQDTAQWRVLNCNLTKFWAP